MRQYQPSWDRGFADGMAGKVVANAGTYIRA
jgi:hypothetical protein